MSEIKSEIFLKRLNNDIPGNEFTLVIREQNFELYRKGKSLLFRFKAQSNTMEEEEYYQYLRDEIRQCMIYTFHREYDNQHALCPKCGSNFRFINNIVHMTRINYVLDLSNQESYVDNNKCFCTNCGNEYVIHDLKNR